MAAWDSVLATATMQYPFSFSCVFVEAVGADDQRQLRVSYDSTGRHWRLGHATDSIDYDGAIAVYTNTAGWCRLPVEVVIPQRLLMLLQPGRMQARFPDVDFAPTDGSTWVARDVLNGEDVTVTVDAASGTVTLFDTRELRLQIQDLTFTAPAPTSTVRGDSRLKVGTAWAGETAVESGPTGRYAAHREIALGGFTVGFEAGPVDVTAAEAVAWGRERCDVVIVRSGGDDGVTDYSAGDRQPPTGPLPVWPG